MDQNERKLTAAKAYKAKDITITKLNPLEMAKMVAKTVLITEAHPFIPQAQGTRRGLL